MAVIDIRGDIVENGDAWIYDWFDVECTTPAYVKSILDAAEKDEEIEVLVNSGGGSVMAGQEIYSALRACDKVTIKIQSLAGSAAGVIAMGGKCLISPVAMIMIHNVSISGANGDYRDMQKNVEILKQMNAAMAEAYVQKSGKPLDEVLEMMDKETWLTANQCVEFGFCDGYLNDVPRSSLTNAIGGMWLTDEIRAKAEKERAAKEAAEEILNDLDDYGI